MTGIGVMEPLSQSKLAEAWAAWNRSTQAADDAAQAQAAEADASAEAESEVEAQPSTPAGAYVEPAEPVGAASSGESRSSGPFSSGPGFARMSWLRRDKDRDNQ